MTEQKRQIPAVDVDHLTAEQVEQLRFVLEALSLHQLVQLAARVRRICAEPGYGQVAVVIKQGHASRVESGESAELLPNLDDDILRSLME